MLRANDLLTHMKAHLSDWLIMRRNPKDSNGGKLLLGVAQGIEDLNLAIQEYVKSFFISSYEDKTHTIDYEYMRIQVGLVTLDQIKVVSPAIEVCNDMQMFIDSYIYCYYEKGYLYFKTALVSENDTIEYVLLDTLIKERAERVPVWNVFDEFALYVGIERIEREDNERLLERILFQALNPVNSSTEGIQNAVANITGLQTKEVIVEAINETNCYQNDFTGKTLFEQFTELNRDIYRSKRWGVDYWHHDRNYTSYIPHAYDINPGYYQDGIGDNMDLKIAMTRKDEIINMKINCYKKSEKAITEYYQKYPIDTETILKLYKPEGMINPIEVTALIEAGTLTEITNSLFNLTYKATRTVCEKVQLSDLIDTTYAKVTVPHYFINGHTYRFKISPKTPFSSFKAKINIDGKSFLTEQSDFSVDNFGYITHKNIKLFVDQLSYFSEHKGFSHEIDGFRLTPYSRKGTLVLPLKNKGGCILDYIVHSPIFDVLSEEAFSYDGFVKSENENSFTSELHTDPLFAIRCDANKLRFFIEGSAIVMVKNKLEDKEYHIENDYFETELESFEPIDYNIHIIPTDTSQIIKIKEIGYTHFKIIETLAQGERVNKRLPNFEENTLTLSISTTISTAPSIGFIYIGESLEDIEYVTNTFKYNNQTINFNSRDDTLFTLEDITASHSITTQGNMTTLLSERFQDLKIDLSNYKEIEDVIACSGGHIIKKGEDYYIRLEENESCSTVIVKGEIIDFTKHYSFDALVNKKKQARYYISPIIEGIIEVLDYDMQIIEPQLNHSYGEYSVVGCEPYIPVFKTINHTIESTTAYAPINTFYLRAPVERKYKAFNKCKMYEECQRDIVIDKNFAPLLPYDKLLFFKVTSLTEGANVFFYNKTKEDKLGTDFESPYSLDISTLNYHADFSLVEQIKTAYQEIALPIRLNKHITLPKFVQNSIGDTLDLREYIITPEKGIEIYYTSPQTEDITADPSYIRTEQFILSADGVKKLQYCQIYEIIYCGFTRYEENAPSTITEYDLIQQLGVIKFSSYFTANNIGRIIYIHYTIKKPSLLILSTEKLYDIKNMNYEAYELKATEYHNSPLGDYKPASENFNQADYITIEIQEPGYIATSSQKQGIIHIAESMARNRIAVHKGFYYVDGKEYYMFGTSSDSHKEYKNDYLEAYDVNYTEDGISLHRQTENYVRNTVLDCKELTRLFATDFAELENLNYFQRMNACEQINLWHACNTRMMLADGLYSKGINFAPVDKEATHFIGMPIKQVGVDLSLSFWLNGTGVPVIYEQLKWEEEIHLTLSSINHVLHFSKQGSIYSIELPYKPEVFYYLAIRGEGTIDDLILCDKNIYDDTCHVKNLDKLFIPQFPSERSDKQRLLFNHQKGYKGTTQMLLNGEIVPTSSLSYGYTKLLPKDWMEYAQMYKATYQHHAIIPQENKAYVLSPVIHVDSKAFIKEILIKANCFSQDNIPIIVYTGNSENSLRPVANTISDYVKIDMIEDYIQVRCELKEALYSLDISARYIEGATPETYRQNIFESELFDLGEIGEYEIEQMFFATYNDAQVYVRSGKTDTLMDDFKLLPLDDEGKMNDNFQLGKSKYVQFKLFINDSCNLMYFDIKEIRE